MAYMRKRSAEAMGDVVMNPFTGLPMDSSLPPGADYAAPTVSTEPAVCCWNGQTVPASQCPPQPTTAAPKAASSMSTTTLLVIAGGVGVGLYLLNKKRR